MQRRLGNQIASDRPSEWDERKLNGLERLVILTQDTGAKR